MMGAMRAGAAGLAVVLLVPALALAEVYRWEDEQGTIYYTNAPEQIPAPYRARFGPIPPRPPSPPVETRAAAVSSSGAITRIPYTPGAPILVSASIGGAGPLTLILDTGADRTLITPQALGRLGIATADGPRTEIRGVTGASYGTVVQVASLEVGEAKAGPLAIVAHDANLKRADGLLGRDFLEHFTVTIDSSERLVTLLPK
jgi:Aspartyl protease/Domain of unknown function (DUF4124)